jgi:hypothetical protein
MPVSGLHCSHEQVETLRRAVGACRDTGGRSDLALLGEHAAQLTEYAELDFDKNFLHHVGQEQPAFVAAFGEKVLPQLRSAS